MENKLLNVISRDKLNISFHDSEALSVVINKDSFILRIAISNSIAYCENLPLVKEDLPKSTNSDDIYIIDLIIKNPVIKYDNFDSTLDILWSQIFSIDYEKNNDGKYSFIINLILFDNEELCCAFNIEGDDYYWNIIGHIFDFNPYINEEEQFIEDNYLYISKNKTVINNNKILNGIEEISPYNLNESYLLGYYINENIFNAKNHPILLRLNIMISLDLNPNLMKQKNKKYDYALINISSNSFKINNINFDSRKEIVLSEILSFELNNNEYYISFSGKDDEVFEMNFTSDKLEYKIVEFYNKKSFKKKILSTN